MHGFARIFAVPKEIQYDRHFGST